MSRGSMTALGEPPARGVRERLPPIQMQEPKSTQDGYPGTGACREP